MSRRLSSPPTWAKAFPQAEMANDARQFYDRLASDYHLLFQDWWAAAQWHGSVIREVLAAEGTRPPAEVLDCTCGIGTQALPLAQMGFRVTGTDVSEEAIRRAREEATDRGLAPHLLPADVRAVHEAVDGPFDAAISCDNSLPHLLTDEDITRALASIHACLRPDGLFLASIRDYDELAKQRAAGVPMTIHGSPGSRHASGQAWEWSAEADRVGIVLFTLRESTDSQWQVGVHQTTYRALLRREMEAALRHTGFRSIRWRMPEESGYYQPIVTARAG